MRSMRPDPAPLCGSCPIRVIREVRGSNKWSAPMTSHIDPDRQAWDAFKSLPRDRPIHMLNLIKLRERAEYPPDHPDHGKPISGLEAYRAYGRTSGPVFKRVGGRQVWAGKPQVMGTGPQDAEQGDRA